MEWINFSVARQPKGAIQHPIRIKRTESHEWLEEIGRSETETPSYQPGDEEISCRACLWIANWRARSRAVYERAGFVLSDSEGESQGVKCLTLLGGGDPMEAGDVGWICVTWAKLASLHWGKWGLWAGVVSAGREIGWSLSLIHIWRCRRIERCRSRWSPYH